MFKVYLNRSRVEALKSFSNLIKNNNCSNFEAKNFIWIHKMSTASESSKKRPRVYVTQSIPVEAMDILKENNLDVILNEKTPLDRDTFLKSVKNIDALFCTLNEKINSELLDEAGSQLKVFFVFYLVDISFKLFLKKVVATCSVGVDHIDLNECFKRKIPIGYTPGVLTGECFF